MPAVGLIRVSPVARSSASIATGRMQTACSTATSGTTSLASDNVAAAIVDAQGRVLVNQRADNGHWEPPGEVLMPHEGVEEGLRREVREETGPEIQPDRLTGVHKNQAGIVAVVFRARVPVENSIPMMRSRTFDGPRR